nr:PREDICTED: uncharacterized protein C1orf43 homolog [Lepisosteus oculatus]
MSQAQSSNSLSGVNVVLVMAYGSLVFVLLFIFVKRQIMRFAMKSRRGPHVPLGHNAPKVSVRLSQCPPVRVSACLRVSLCPSVPLFDCPPVCLRVSPCSSVPLSAGLTVCCLSAGCYNYLYRMRALDAIRDSDIPFQEMGKNSRSLTGRSFQSFLLELRGSHPVSGHSGVGPSLGERLRSARACACSRLNPEASLRRSLCGEAWDRSGQSRHPR